jgi:transcriptional regulator with XRE-family HTH domain
MDNKKVGRFISTMRKSLQLTQQEIAEKLGVTNKAVSKWETGEGYPEITIVPALAEILGVTVDELLNGEKLRNQKIELTTTESAKRYEYILDKAVLKFKNVHIITTAISVLGIILSYVIAFSTPYKGLAVLGIVLVVLSISVFLVNYNRVKVSCEKCIQLYPGYSNTLINRSRFHRNIIFSVWIWIFSICIIIAFVLPDKLFSRFATIYRFHILFMIGIVMASVISCIIQIQYKGTVK